MANELHGGALRVVTFLCELRVDNNLFKAFFSISLTFRSL